MFESTLEFVMSSALTQEYIEIFNDYTQRYGDAVCVLMQKGSFYEILQIKNDKENIGNATSIASLLNIQLTKSNKKIQEVSRTNPIMCGIPVHSLSKYIPVLLSHDYTIVIVDEVGPGRTRTKRQVAQVLSPGAPPIDMDVSSMSLENIILCIAVDIVPAHCITPCSSPSFTICAGLCTIDVTTGTVNLHEFFSDSTDIEHFYETTRSFIQMYKPKEVILHINKSESPEQIFTAPNESLRKLLNTSLLLDTLDLLPSTTHVSFIPFPKHYFDSSFQNELLNKLYSTINFGMLSPLETFDMERTVYAAVSFIVCTDFIYAHNETYLNNLLPPCLKDEKEALVLASNTLRQLHVLPIVDSGCHSQKFDSLFGVLDKVSTVIGRRKLKRLLSCPLTSDTAMLFSYGLTSDLEKTSYKTIEEHLEGIIDFERLHRKMALGVLHPYELFRLHNTYTKISYLFEYLSSHASITEMTHVQQILPDASLLSDFGDYQTKYSKTFIIDDLQKYSLNESAGNINNYFAKGAIRELDDLTVSISSIEMSLLELCTSFSKAVATKRDLASNDFSQVIKLACNDNDGYFFTTTNARANVLKKWLQETGKLDDFTFQSNKSETKIFSHFIEKCSRSLLQLRSELQIKIKEHYIATIKEFYAQYSHVMDKLLCFIESIDVANANLKCSKLYNYVRPVIDLDSQSPFFDARDLRHPIIERINTNTKYVPNDVALDSDHTGLILYGLNACGKSSLLRSIGLCIIMAQAGLYVPCSSFRFKPFKTIVSQVDLHDNLWKGQSSFVTEMMNLRSILKHSNESTLVLADELCKGSEVNSATAIFASAVNHLSSNNVKFAFTTHLHQVSQLPLIQQSNIVRIAHLSVDILKDNTIVFSRKLQDGPSQDLYGLEVAQALNLDSSFISTAFSIRNDIIGKRKEILVHKKSRYNKQKIVDHCEVCGYTTSSSNDIPLHTHHIHFQSSADSSGFIQHFHKNSKFNLVSLCHSCHDKVHNGDIEIYGYVQTTNGIHLDVRTRST